jgi:hypothetical protein
VLIIGGGLVGLGIAWIAITGLIAKQQASQLETRLGQVRTLVSQGQVAQARDVAKDIPAMARRMHRLTTGPAWWTAAQIPYFGDPIDVTREVATATNDVGSHAVPELMKIAGEIDPDALRVSGSTIRISSLAAAQPDLQKSAAILEQADRRVAGATSNTWLSPVDTRRDEFAQQLSSLKGYVDAAERASRVLPAMLGADGPKRYFIGLQNESELRGTGGLPGAFAIATADHGTIKFTNFESDTVLLPEKTKTLVPTSLGFGAEYAEAYAASDPTSSYIDSNVSPNFPYAAQIWAAMYEKVSGKRVDGVLALDPTVLSYFLQVIGPATIPGTGTVTADNVVSVTEKDQYAIFPDNADRKKFVVGVLKAAANKLISGSGSATGLVQAASRSASEQRLLVWSRDPTVEALLEQTSYAGALPTGSRPFSGLILNNAAAGKLDYYLDRSITYSRTGCGSRRDVQVSIALTNTAPASGLPSYVTTRLDTPPAAAKPGDNRVLLDYYATDGALLQSVSLNGQVTTASALQIQGHAVFRMYLELPRGTTQTIVLHLDEPAGKGAPRIWRQPGVTPIDAKVLNQSC